MLDNPLNTNKMNKYKRDFNMAAKILLGLSMFAVGMTIVNSILII